MSVFISAVEHVEYCIKMFTVAWWTHTIRPRDSLIYYV